MSIRYILRDTSELLAYVEIFNYVKVRLFFSYQNSN